MTIKPLPVLVLCQNQRGELNMSLVATKNNTAKEIFISLASILEYPNFGLDDTSKYKEFKSRVDALSKMVAGESSAANDSLKLFRESLEKLSAYELEEVYTLTFDITPSCFIYAGYLLFGESNKRLEFLVQLKEKYKEFGFEHESLDLPDHLSVLIRFLAHLSMSSEESAEVLYNELLEDCLIPATNIMKRSFDKIQNRKEQDKIDVSMYFTGLKNPYFYLISMTGHYLMTLVPQGFTPIEVTPEKADFDPEELYKDQNEDICGGCNIPEQVKKVGNLPPFIKYKNSDGSQSAQLPTSLDLPSNEAMKDIKGDLK